MNLRQVHYLTSIMKKTRILLLFGGTGFIGRAVTEKFLKNDWQIIIPTRCNNLDEAKKRLTLHGFKECYLDKYIRNGLILFIFNIDLTSSRWKKLSNWLELFNESDISIKHITRIINLVGETSKSAHEIYRSNVDIVDNISVLIKYLKTINKNLIFLNIGSTAERKSDKNLSSYEKAKKIVREKIEKSNLCDYHFVVGYVKGRGEQKVKSVAPYLLSRLKFSRKWLFGFSVSIVDVDNLADVLFFIPFQIKNTYFKEKPLEVNVTNGELLFGEMIESLLPKNERSIPKRIIPKIFEKYFLLSYIFIVSKFKSNNQLSRRLSNFAKRGLMLHAQQSKLRNFKTSKEIKKLALDNANYSVLRKDSYLIVINNYKPVLYVLREKSKKELKQIVQKAIVIPD